MVSQILRYVLLILLFLKYRDCPCRRQADRPRSMFGRATIDCSPGDSIRSVKPQEFGLFPMGKAGGKVVILLVCCIVGIETESFMRREKQNRKDDWMKDMMIQLDSRQQVHQFTSLAMCSHMSWPAWVAGSTTRLCFCVI